MRVEFNPNKLTHEEMLWLKQNIIDYMEDDGFTRLDLAFDFEDDLSDYYTMTDKAVKKTIFYGRNGKPETKYFGVRDSDRFIRIYNKKQERKDNADVEVMFEHLWRVEIELKRDMVDYWNDCFNDLHILKPAWTTLEKINEQAMVYTLLHEESMWGKLSKNTKTKFKKLIREISPIDLTELMKSTLKANEKQLKKHIDFWQHEFGFLLIIAILLMIIIPDNSDLPTLFALLAFTIYSIPGILKKKVSGWVLGILGLIFIILFLI